MTQPETVVIDGITLNVLDENGAPKSAKQLDKEAKKAAKLLKLSQKNEKKAATAAVAATKEKVEVSVSYVRLQSKPIASCNQSIND